MSIRVFCGCGRKIVANERWAGKTVRCPQCQAAVSVPAALTQAESPTDGDDAELCQTVEPAPSYPSDPAYGAPAPGGYYAAGSDPSSAAVPSSYNAAGPQQIPNPLDPYLASQYGAGPNGAGQNVNGPYGSAWYGYGGAVAYPPPKKGASSSRRDRESNRNRLVLWCAGIGGVMSLLLVIFVIAPMAWEKLSGAVDLAMTKVPSTEPPPPAPTAPPNSEQPPTSRPGSMGPADALGGRGREGMHPRTALPNDPLFDPKAQPNLPPKMCGNCKQQIPRRYTAGDRCPHCHCEFDYDATNGKRKEISIAGLVFAGVIALLVLAARVKGKE